MECDILIVGGGMGGCAAALAAADQGKRVILLEETRWLGGQMTSQGVSAMDEHQYIETFGGTKSYYALREGIRDYYRDQYDLSVEAKAAQQFNPGNGWVSRLCFEPRAAVHVLNEMMATHVQEGRLHIFLETKVSALQTNGHVVKSATAVQAEGKRMEIDCRVVIDATELGDLLPLAGIPYVTGSESKEDTGEQHAQEEADKDRVQSFTFPFAVEWRDGEDHTIAKPDGYERFRDTQPYTFDVWYGEEKGFLTYRMFENVPNGPLAFWTYRRLIDAGNFSDDHFPQDIAMINWPGNDYRGGNIIDVSEDERNCMLDEAKRLALGFLYWLQTEAPRDDGGYGYPELKLRKDVMGTDDGLSMYPYIRESRRIVALTRIIESDVCAYEQPYARARNFEDSIGIGYYPIDIHACHGEEQFDSGGLPSRPYQIPLGALVPAVKTNLIAGNKNIGTTHITNGAYRLHPVEWNIGESAGLLAAFVLETGKHPHAIRANRDAMRDFQTLAVSRGIPIYWFTDVPLDDACFFELQNLAGAGIVTGDRESLTFHPDNPLTEETAAQWAEALSNDVGIDSSDVRNKLQQTTSRREAVKYLYGVWRNYRKRD